MMRKGNLSDGNRPGFRLTENDKKVLRQISMRSQVTDTEIAQELSISQQAVYQIRKKLENHGVIKGYLPIIDYDKIGIEVFAIVGLTVRPAYWESNSEAQINKKFMELPCTHGVFRILSSSLSYILTFGFKDLQEGELFLSKIETMLSEGFMLKWSHILTINNVLKHDDLNLVLHALNDDGSDIEAGLRKLIG